MSSSNANELIVVFVDGKATKQKFNSLAKRSQWFATKREAEQDYLQSQKAAPVRLDKIQVKLVELQETLNFEIGYEFRRHI